MDINKKFIKTSDEETANKLKAYGLKCIGISNGMWTFINEISKINFDEDKKIIYTNKIEI